MNESCHTYEWVMSHIWMSHVPHTNKSSLPVIFTCVSHVAHMNESCPHVNESCHTYEWVMSHIWMSHVPHTNESTLPVISTWAGRVTHIRMSHVPHMNESFPTYEWILFTSNLHLNGSCPRCGWVLSQIWTSHVSDMNKSCHTYMPYVKLVIYVIHDSFICICHRSSPVQCVAALFDLSKTHIHMRLRCSMLQCVAVCCSVLQCVAVCYSVLQCVALCCRVLQCVAASFESSTWNDAVLAGSPKASRHWMWCSTLQCFTVCCSVLRHHLIIQPETTRYWRVRQRSHDAECVVEHCNVL